MDPTVKRELSRSQGNSQVRDIPTEDNPVVPTLSAQKLYAFFEKIAVADECWIWTGAFSETGYPVFFNEASVVERAHRTASRWFVGSIAGANEIDHLCNDKRCVNPRHLRSTDREAHIQRHVASREGRCRKGHIIADGNAVHSTSGGRPVRKCAICHRERAKVADREARHAS